MIDILEVKVELFKRKMLELIPIGEDNRGRFSNKQIEAFILLTDNITTNIGYGGSARSGKSYLECYYLFLSSLAYPKTRWGMGRRELKNLKKTTLQTLFKVFAENNFKEYKYDQQASIITMYNGSEIYLMDTAYQPSDPLYTRFGGLELTGAVIDESNESPYDAILTAFTRCGWCNNEKYGLKKKLLETFNPDKGHVNKRYWKPFKNKNEEEHKKFIRALPSDNPDPAVDDWIKDVIKQGDKVKIERLIHGNFDYDDDDSRLFDYDKLDDIFTNTFVDTGIHYITADIARKGKDKTVIGIWNGFRCEKIITIDKSTLTEVADVIQDLRIKNRVSISNIICDEDGVGGGVVDILKCKGFKNNRKAFRKENYKNLKSQCYFYLSKLINSSRLYVNILDEQTKEIIKEELDVMKEDNIDNDGKVEVIRKDKIKEIIGRSPDYADMLMMRCYFEVIK